MLGEDRVQRRSLFLDTGSVACFWINEEHETATEEVIVQVTARQRGRTDINWL